MYTTHESPCLPRSQLSQDKSLHVLFDIMTNAWGQDPPDADDEEPAEDDDALLAAAEDEYLDLEAGVGAAEPRDAAVDAELSALTQQLQILKSLGYKISLSYACLYISFNLN